MHATTVTPCNGWRTISNFVRPNGLGLTEEGDVCILDVEWLHAEQAEPLALIDATLATLLGLGRYGTGLALEAKAVELARPKFEVQAHEAYFGCRVHFSASHNHLVLHRADLDRTFAAYNAELLEMLTPALDQALADRQRLTSFTQRVTWLLTRQLSGGRLDIPAIAMELGMSERTPQRRLAEEGTNFLNLVDHSAT